MENINTFNDAMDFIKYSEKFGSVLGLDTMTRLLHGLNNPQDKLKFIHVAGTNGKGSTSTFISTILAMSGCKIGRYISPSVISYEEKIQVLCSENGEIKSNYIDKSNIVTCIQQIKNVCDDMVLKGFDHPTTFEIETAMCFLYFLSCNCDLVVLEVGLGGRLDATNVIKNVVCSVITSISMDHMEYLGDSLDKIAREKAGIIKENGAVVSYQQDEIVEKVLKEVSDSKNAKLIIADFNKIKEVSYDIDGSYFTYKTYKDLKIHLLGENQIYNAVVALHVMDILKQFGYGITEEAIRKGFLRTKFRCRFEVLRHKPIIVIDGAHNEDAAKVLAKNIRLYFRDKKITFLMGVLKDKDYEGILQHTAHLAQNIITVTPNNKRGLDSTILANTALKYCNHVENADLIRDGVNLALNTSSKEDVIIVFGSLSYLKDVYSELGINN